MGTPLTPEKIATVPSEHAQQTALFAWAALPETRAALPGIELMFAIPNGGERNLKVASNLKAEGVKAGVADVFLPVPVRNYPTLFHGFFFEMKYGPNKLSDEQRVFLGRMSEQGYHIGVFWTFEAARNAVIAYLSQR